MPNHVPAPDNPEKTCRCGRWNNKIHCPNCGYYTVIGLASKKEIVDGPDGKPVIVNCFRCRRCLHVFNETDWKVRCDAPRLETDTMTERRQRDHAAIKTRVAVEDARQTAEAKGASKAEASRIGIAYMFYRMGNTHMLGSDDWKMLNKYLDIPLPKTEV
jgi:hypothetical protein